MEPENPVDGRQEGASGAWFEEVWRQREEEFYPELFGANTGGIYNLDAGMFETFGLKSPDPRWLTMGVIVYPPNEKRSSWLYATSGLSNPWGDDVPDPRTPSGLGCEFVMETPEQADWALFTVRRVLAFQILLAAGLFQGRDPLGIGDRLPMQGPLDGGNSKLTYCIIAPPDGYPGSLQMPSGSVQFMHIIGATEQEAGLAREKGLAALLELLRDKGYPVTDSGRSSVV